MDRNKQERNNFDREEGKKEGGREGRKNRRKKETKAELQNTACTFRFTHVTVTFKQLQAPRNLQVLGSKCGSRRALYRF